MQIFIMFSILLIFLMLITFFSCLFFKECMIWVELELFSSSVDSSPVIFLFLFDYMSLLFISVVSLISSVVMFYSFSYMMEDGTKTNFFFLVLGFVFSMILMILSPNLISILLGWDGLGLISYMLVIYFQNTKSFSAGMITFLSNRIGDLLILLSIAWSLNWGSFDFMNTHLIYLNFSYKLVCFLLFMAAMTKSAQIPFSAWLPAAMAAPTPVSSLVHSSTLVTAGVYLIIRFNLILSFNFYLLMVSLMTMFLSSLSAFFETDMKKIIALSTLSQLGLMMFSLSLGLKDLAFFHLISHALFKSLIFLCAGAYIHFYFNSQELRMVLNMSLYSSLFSVYFLYSNLSLVGLFFLSGFYSKDTIIETFYMGLQLSFVLILLILSVILTLGYTFRLLNNCLNLKMKIHSIFNNKAEDFIMYVPMFILFLLSLMGSSMFLWLYFPLSLNYMTTSLKIVVSFFLIFMIMISSSFYLNLNSKKMSSFFGKMWMLPLLSYVTVMYFISKSRKLILSFDQGWLEMFGAQGLKLSFLKLNNKFNWSSMFGVKMMLCIILLISYMMMILV